MAGLGRAALGDQARASGAAPCPPGLDLAAWLAEWEEPDDAGVSWLENADALSMLWVRSLRLAPDGSGLRFRETPSMLAASRRLRRRARPARYGPVLHNEGREGFDPQLGERLLARPEPVLAELARLAQRQRWTSLNVDLESLGPEAALPYERFLDQLLRRFRGTPVRLSVDLHPRTSDDAPYDGAAFQRWRALAGRDLDFVIMGYDHAWASSPPGPVAPLGWTLEVMKYAAATLPPERIVFALPLYGYRWLRAPDGGWRGTAALAPALGAVVDGQPGWSRDASLAEGDGRLFRRGDGEAIAFDDFGAALIKVTALAGVGARRFALWRLGPRISLAPFRALTAPGAADCPPPGAKRR
jgi:hypothetical protein